MIGAPWRIGNRTGAPGGLILAARVVLSWAGLGWHWEPLGRAALGREPIQEEMDLVTEQSLRPGQKGKSGNKIIRK